jgi:sodium transport system permease protein
LLNSNGDGFNPALFDTPVDAERIVVRRESASGPWGEQTTRQRAIRDDNVSAVMLIPRDLPAQLQRENSNEIHIPIQYNSVDEPS